MRSFLRLGSFLLQPVGLFMSARLGGRLGIGATRGMLAGHAYHISLWINGHLPMYMPVLWGIFLGHGVEMTPNIVLTSWY